MASPKDIVMQGFMAEGCRIVLSFRPTNCPGLEELVFIFLWTYDCTLLCRIQWFVVGLLRISTLKTV